MDDPTSLVDTGSNPSSGAGNIFGQALAAIPSLTATGISIAGAINGTNGRSNLPTSAEPTPGTPNNPIKTVNGITQYLPWIFIGVAALIIGVIAWPFGRGKKA